MTGSESLIKKLVDKFGGWIVVEGTEPQASIVVDKNKLREMSLFLKADQETPFDMLTDLFAVDLYGQDPRFEVVYLLNSTKSKNRLTMKVRLNDSQYVETVSDIWRAAEWLEREAFDMFGLRFHNHPDLRRILMVEDFNGYPLRKDFPTEGYGFDQPFRVDLEEKV
ncbi:MAG: NADH-quinone oxidoreductase chain 5 [Syntrophorhabdaceae bacterium PtaU1.Bin034]|nr:MAG: NADH-quinone oxidoreductase chain 5 [Syntrophorhabdaceae bacterium PtaU1.Bin034]